MEGTNALRVKKKLCVEKERRMKWSILELACSQWTPFK